MAVVKTVLTTMKKWDHLECLVINDIEKCARFGDIVIAGLASPDDFATISDLMEAAQHKNKTRTFLKKL